MSLLKFLSNLTLAAAAVQAPVAAPITLKDCGGSAALFQLTSAVLDPAAPAPGEKVALTLQYTVPEMIRIVDGTSKYEVSLNFVPLATTVHPLCQDVLCPITPGTHSNTTSSVWPSGVSGRFVSKMTWKGVNWRRLVEEEDTMLRGPAREDTDEQLLLCLQVSGTLGHASEETPKRNLRAER